MNLNNETLGIWLDAYKGLKKSLNRNSDLATKYGKAGDENREHHALIRVHEIEAQMKGMLQALEIFGYTIIVENYDMKVVPYK